MYVTRNFGHVDDSTTWQQLFSELIFRIDRAKLGKNFSGNLRIRQAGDIQVAHIVTTRIERLERSRSSSIIKNKPTITVVLQLEGTSTFAQNGRSISLKKDGLTCIDPTRPVVWELSENCEAFLVDLPLSALKEVVGPTADLTCVRLSDSNALASLLAAYLRNLTGQLDGISEEASYSLAQIALDLVIVALAEPPINNTPSIRGNVLHRAQTYIQAHSRNSSLSPPVVAAALKISERYLQKIFKEAGLTTRGYLLQCRLKNAEADLSNPSLSRLSIAEIAIRAGFNEPTHFSQRFREVYGESAREYRRRAKDKLGQDRRET